MLGADEEPAVGLPLPPLTPNTPRSTRDLAIETAVVLGICVLPNLFREIISPYFFPPRHTALPFLYESFSEIILDSGRIAFIAYLILRSGEPLSRFGLRQFRVLPDFLGGAGIYILDKLWYLLIWIVIDFLQKHSLINISRRNYDVLAHPSNAMEYVILVFMCLAIGFAEEIIYRAYLIPRFEELLESTALALLFSTVLFGGGHIYQGEHGFISAIAAGLLFGGMFCLFRRLWPIAIAHAIWDFIIYVRVH